MKTVRIIVLILTAAVAFSACESPSDITDKQNVIPVGALPVRSVTVDIEKAVNKEVNNSFKGVDVSVTFFPEYSFIDVNSKTPYLTLKLDANVPIPPTGKGAFVKDFSLNVNNVIADGRTYIIRGGNNQGVTAGAEFRTVTFYNALGQMQSKNDTYKPTDKDSAFIQFTHDPVNKTVLGNLTAFIKKDTVMRIPLNITADEADSIYQEYTALGFEMKDEMPEIDTVNSEIIFPAIQILLNVHSTITVQY